MARRYNGTVQWFDAATGHGWIIPEGQVWAVWVYKEDFVSDLLGQLAEGVKVNFEIARDLNPKNQSNKKAVNLQMGWREETAEATAETRTAMMPSLPGRMR